MPPALRFECSCTRSPRALNKHQKIGRCRVEPHLDNRLYARITSAPTTLLPAMR